MWSSKSQISGHQMVGILDPNLQDEGSQMGAGIPDNFLKDKLQFLYIKSPKSL